MPGYRFTHTLCDIETLNRKAQDEASDRRRERFMWTRMKEHLEAKGLGPQHALYLCGAIHDVRLF